MAASPKLAPPIERAPEIKKLTLREPSPTPRPKQPAPDLLHKIFEGHEDFLGWTPD